MTRYDDASARAAGREKGSVMTVVFELEGQPFTALNGGPMFTFTEAISLVVLGQALRRRSGSTMRVAQGARTGTPRGPGGS